MQIREANIQDIEQLAELFDAYRKFYGKTSDIKQATIFLTERIQHKESVIFVAENEHKILAGFVQLYPIFSSTRLKRLWLLNDLFVSENYRNQGISIALIEQCKKLCLESNSCGMYLETAKTNIVGNNLYPKTGFQLDQENNFYTWFLE